MKLSLQVTEKLIQVLKEGLPFPLQGSEDIVLTYKDKGVREVEELPCSLLSEAETIEKLNKLFKTVKDVKILFRPFGLDSDPKRKSLNASQLTLELIEAKPKSIEYTSSWSKQLFRPSYGVSNYKNLSYFMPKWSTAYKFPWSTHARTVEPFFSHLFYLKNLLKHRLTDDGYGEDYFKYVKPRELKVKAPSTYYTLSKNQEHHLINVPYYNNQQTTLDFGYILNSIYIKPIAFLDEFEVSVEGEYNNAWFFETVKITSSSVIRLKNPYHKIHNILITSFDKVDLDTTLIRVSNYLPLQGFNAEEREDSLISFSDGFLHLYDKKTFKREATFTLNLPSADGYYVTKDDHIIAVTPTRIYTGKVDLKLDLPLPLDVSYNNSRFIEEMKVSEIDYDLELFLNDYLDYAGQDMVAVRVLTSKGESFYLDENLSLQPSDTPIYLSSVLTRTAKSLSLSLSLTHEYSVIRLEDYNNKFVVSHLVCHPEVELTTAFKYNEIDIKAFKFEDKISKAEDIDSIAPIIIEGKVWLYVRYKDPVSFSALLVPLESSVHDEAFSERDLFIDSIE